MTVTRPFYFCALLLVAPLAGCASAPDVVPRCEKNLLRVGYWHTIELWPSAQHAQTYGLPEDYHRLRLEGEVEVEFTVTPSGRAIDPLILSSNAGSEGIRTDLRGFFDEKALEHLAAIKFPEGHHCRQHHNFSWETAE